MKSKIKMNVSQSLSVEEAFELFVRKCRVKNLSESTIISYKNKVIPFVTFCDERKISSISEEVVDEFVLVLKREHNVNDVSIVSYMRSVRAFLYYCMRCGYMKQFRIELPKAQKALKETYTISQMEKLLKKPDMRSCSFSEYKIWVFENYIFGTGNRLSTALNVCIKDIDFSSSMITLRKTKNRKQQLIPLSASLAEILREYLEIRGGDAEDYLFCNDCGEKATNRGFQTLVYRYNIKREVNITSIHAMRHTFAKNWILAGGDPFRLQKILGHSDLTVTKEYIAMFGQDLQMDFEKYNPLDNLLKKNREKIRM